MVNKIAISGSSGYIANHFSNFLEKKKINVLKFSSTKNKKFIFVNKNYSSLSKYKKELKEINFFFHFAYLNELDLANKNYKEYIKKNLIILRSILTNLSNKTTFIFISSVSVYGSSNKISTELSKLSPLSNYDRGKLRCEKYLLDYFKKNKKKIIILRIPNIYGFQKFNKFTNRGIIPFLLTKILKNKNILLHTDGKQLRDYLHISDLLIALFKITKIKNEHNIYNILSEKSFSLNFVINQLIDNLKNIKNFRYTGRIYYNTENKPNKTDLRNFTGSARRFKNNYNWSCKKKIKIELKKEIALCKF